MIITLHSVKSKQKQRENELPIYSVDVFITQIIAETNKNTAERSFTTMFK